MDYKVVVATAGPTAAGVGLVAARVDLVDIKVGFVDARVVGKALFVHKVLVE